jgi:hypothetical protein
MPLCGKTPIGEHLLDDPVYMLRSFDASCIGDVLLRIDGTNKGSRPSASN